MTATIKKKIKSTKSTFGIYRRLNSHIWAFKAINAGVSPLLKS